MRTLVSTLWMAGLLRLYFWFGYTVTRWYNAHRIRKPGRLSRALIREAQASDASGTAHVRVVKRVYNAYLFALAGFAVWVVVQLVN